ncbi:MAG: hypothetical protein Q9216_001613 [Gyalolechia sp. 2 TL-2023]
MIFVFVLACILNLVECKAIPAVAPAPGKPPSIAASRYTTPRSATYDIPNTLVRITLTRYSGYEIDSGSVPPFLQSALIALDQAAEAAGGPTAPLEPSRRTIGHTAYGLTMRFDDITIYSPEVAGGRLRYDEVRAVYLGTAATIHQIGSEECSVHAWRLVDGRSGRYRVKFLMNGYLANVRGMAASMARLGLNDTAGVDWIDRGGEAATS